MEKEVIINEKETIEETTQEVIQQENITREDIQIITNIGILGIALLFAIFITKGR